jgi:hypothetical protein
MAHEPATTTIPRKAAKDMSIPFSSMVLDPIPMPECIYCRAVYPRCNKSTGCGAMIYKIPAKKKKVVVVATPLSIRSWVKKAFELAVGKAPR